MLWDAKKVRDGNWAASDVRSQVLQFLKKEKGLDSITVSIFVLVISQMLSNTVTDLILGQWPCALPGLLFYTPRTPYPHCFPQKALLLYPPDVQNICWKMEMENTQEIDFWTARIAGLGVGTTKWPQNTKSPFEVQLVQWLKKIMKNKIEEKNHPLTSSRSSGSLRPHLSQTWHCWFQKDLIFWRKMIWSIPFAFRITSSSCCWRPESSIEDLLQLIFDTFNNRENISWYYSESISSNHCELGRSISAL